MFIIFFFFNDTATTEIYTLSLHDALPIYQVRVAVLLLFVGSAMAIGIASSAWSVFRRYSSTMALWVLALAIISFALQAVDNRHILSMLSLSQEYAKAGADKADFFQSLAVVVG